jgi:hypothetical protein
MKWFTLDNEVIEGPYSTEMLLRKMESGDISSSSLIWGPLQAGWKPFEWWKQALPHLKSVQSEIETFEQWHYVKEGRRIGPMKRAELVNQLKAMADGQEMIAKVLVWTKGFSKWTPVIALHDLMNELGIDQRKHPRARAHGKISISFQGQTFSTTLKTISEGGLGAEPIPMVYPGEEVVVTIDSEVFGSPINAKAEVRYMGPTDIGLQFLSLNSECKSTIVTYIKNRSSQSHKVAA